MSVYETNILYLEGESKKVAQNLAHILAQISDAILTEIKADNEV